MSDIILTFTIQAPEVSGCVWEGDIHYKSCLMSEGADKDMQDKTLFFLFFSKNDKKCERGEIESEEGPFRPTNRRSSQGGIGIKEKAVDG